MDDAEHEAYRKRKAEAKKLRRENAKMMGLEYFLEMVDEKHRYGSHLRSYHAEWKKADTHENFFYWLDQGDGLKVEVDACSREVLDRDQVRYLTREERANYLVKVDDNGRLIWSKNNQRLHTSYQFKDSLGGIVPAESNAPVFREAPHGKRNSQQSPDRPSSSTSSSSGSSEDSAADGAHYVNHELNATHGIKKLQKVSAGALLNHLLQSTTKKNTWIFVADTSFRLYVGIKQSGAFQHSSFLRGARIAAAGLLKVKDGQLRSLSPLSGHYRPPTRNFRAFVHNLKASGVDMSRVSISKSYAVLLGVEGYMKTKKETKAGLKDAELAVERLFNPEAVKKREELERDNSESAKKELEHVRKVKSAELEKKREASLFWRMQRKFGVGKGKSSQ